MDLMGGKSQDVELTSTALPSRGLYWVVFLVTWTPETTGPAGDILEFSVSLFCFGCSVWWNEFYCKLQVVYS